MPKSPQFLAKRLRTEGEKMTAYFTGCFGSFRLGGKFISETL